MKQVGFKVLVQGTSKVTQVPLASHLQTTIFTFLKTGPGGHQAVGDHLWESGCDVSKFRTTARNTALQAALAVPAGVPPP